MNEQETASKQDSSTLLSRNITVAGHRTSVRLEPAMWQALQEIAGREQCTIHDLCTLIGLRKKDGTSLTAAIRVFLMLYYRSSSTEDGHMKAHHGSFTDMIVRAKVPEDQKIYFSHKNKKRKNTPKSFGENNMQRQANA